MGAWPGPKAGKRQRCNNTPNSEQSQRQGSHRKSEAAPSGPAFLLSEKDHQSTAEALAGWGAPHHRGELWPGQVRASVPCLKAVSAPCLLPDQCSLGRPPPRLHPAIWLPLPGAKPSFPGPLLPPSPFRIIRLPGSHPSSGQIHLNQDDRNSQARRSTHGPLGTVPSSLRRA